LAIVPNENLNIVDSPTIFSTQQAIQDAVKDATCSRNIFEDLDIGPWYQTLAKKDEIKIAIMWHAWASPNINDVRVEYDTLQLPYSDDFLVVLNELSFEGLAHTQLTLESFIQIEFVKFSLK